MPRRLSTTAHFRRFKDWHDLEKVPNIDLKKLAAEKDRIEF